MSNIDGASFVKGMAYLGAGLAALGCIGGGLGAGNAAGKAVEGVARQPEAKGAISSTMIVGIAFAEATSVYAFLIGMMLVIFS